MRTAVIGDIHANAIALKATLAAVNERGFDHCVLLGDLLTYGVDVAETLDIVHEFCRDGRAILLRGNHDAMYDDVAAGRASAYAEKLPDWIRESVDWTVGRLDPQSWQSLPFQDEWMLGNWLFSHANPFGPANWRYLDRPEDCAEAIASLAARGFQLGVFGHTHRARVSSLSTPLRNWSELQAPSTLALDQAPWLVNAGSPGQPRESVRCPALVLWLEHADAANVAQIRFQAVAVDADMVCLRRRAAGFSTRLLSRLEAYDHVVEVGH